MPKEKSAFASPERTAFELEDGHHCFPGRYGFEKEGGAIRIARDRGERMAGLDAAEEGTLTLLNSVNTFVANRLAEIARLRDKTWDDIAADLNVDFRKVALQIKEGVVTVTGDAPVGPTPSEATR
jgi:hypothetical protein